MELENVIHEVSQAVATITLNRPQAANAQSPEALAEFDRASQSADRAVNHTLDIQGYTNAIDSIFDMHHFGHARAALETGGIPRWSASAQ